MRKIKLIISLIVLMLVTNISYGQQEPKIIKHTTLSIFNNSSKNLNIKLGLTINDLKPYLIISQEKWISPTFPLNSKPLFTIKTSDEEVKYTLRLNKTYMIFWSNNKKRWDITRVKSTN